MSEMQNNSVSATNGNHTAQLRNLVTSKINGMPEPVVTRVLELKSRVYMIDYEGFYNFYGVQWKYLTFLG